MNYLLATVYVGLLGDCLTVTSLKDDSVGDEMLVKTCCVIRGSNSISKISKAFWPLVTA